MSCSSPIDWCLCPTPALSSLSSQSPPTSPFITPSLDNPPPLAPPLPCISPTNLSLSQCQSEKVDAASVAADGDSEAKIGPLSHLEDKPAESLDQSPSCPWEPKAWPEGCQVLTHLVEGFVIQEGLQPFPVRTHTHRLCLTSGSVLCFLKGPSKDLTFEGPANGTVYSLCRISWLCHCRFPDITAIIF